ncbi:hypothetical protein J5Y04_16260 [Kitasatospora sp. RG8]|uniref:EF-Tu/IF-2/RF-3 family GTPase n=1 Tax=Kitasatospora sp. RG8 TaxID=2820815 RepID=UPI001AE0D3EA|nr:EF-Tu/IF-2/RF-3 family GTPase [Kitasatospora sp. RG8]MBP0451085.1 hypothetical protein [Kitasatospora sp. RG8]
MPETEPPFLMTVEDVFGAHPAGTALCGEVRQGVVRIGDELEVVGLLPTRRFTVSALEEFRKPLAEARAGANIAVLVPGVNREQVSAGQVLATPGTIRPHTRLRVTLRAATEPGAALQLLFSPRSPAVDATVDLPPGAGAIAPDVAVDVTLGRPVVCEEGAEFSVVIDTGHPVRSTRHIGGGRITATLD